MEVLTQYQESIPPGLGLTQASFVNTAATVSTVVNTASSVVNAIPTKPVTVQSDFSKTANVVATGASVVAAATVWFPPAAIVAGIVAAAAALLGKVFANSKAKSYAAERGEWDKVNADLRYENQQLDFQFIAANNAVQQLRDRVASLSGVAPISNGLGDLGICWGNCKDEKRKLQSAKEEYEVLTREQQNKTQIMASLLDEYNKLMKGLLELHSDKSSKDWIFWILAGAGALIGGILLFQNRKKIKKELSK
ncbi:MAG TPA: hypothetical protein VIU12_08400 [Chryseolinea sp.]